MCISTDRLFRILAFLDATNVFAPALGLDECRTAVEHRDLDYQSKNLSTVVLALDMFDFCKSLPQGEVLIDWIVREKGWFCVPFRRWNRS